MLAFQIQLLKEHVFLERLSTMVSPKFLYVCRKTDSIDSPMNFAVFQDGIITETKPSSISRCVFPAFCGCLVVFSSGIYLILIHRKHGPYHRSEFAPKAKLFNTSKVPLHFCRQNVCHIHFVNFLRCETIKE